MATTEGQQVPRGEVSKHLTSGRSSNSGHSGQLIPSQEIGLMSPPPRPESLALRAGNRLSLSLPIQAGERDAAWLMKHALTDSAPSTRQASPSLDIDHKLPNNSASNFLVALAAQERRVLELKEELYRAESQLKKLKRQWALHEPGRNTVRPGVENQQVELRQINSTLSSIDGPNDGSEEEDKAIRRSLNLDVDRRKAILEASKRDSRRKVISGGHTRALSLLSPVQSHYGQTTPIPQSTNSTKVHAATAIISPGPNQISTQMSSNKTRHSYQGSAAIGVKQIAEDIKSGLWTFMEDLRQATVGEEATKGASLMKADLTPRRSIKKDSRGTTMTTDHTLARTPQESSSASKTREMERRRSPVPADAPVLGEGTEMISRTPTANGKKVETANSLDDDWSNWDSPALKEETARWSNSTALSSQDANSGSRLVLNNY